MKIKILLLTYLLSVATLWAQEPQFINYTLTDGLPSNEVYETVQDDLGYLWVATDAGVARFDGYSFHNFTKKDGLPEDVVIDLYKDDIGRIWFVTLSSGICYWQDGKIHPYPFNDLLSEMLGNKKAVYSFYANSRNEIYISKSDVGLIKIDSLGAIEENPFKDVYTNKTGTYFHEIEDDQYALEMLNINSAFISEKADVDYFHNFVCINTTEGFEPELIKMEPNLSPGFTFTRGVFSYQNQEDQTYINAGQKIFILEDEHPTKIVDPWKNTFLSILVTEDYLLSAEGLDGVRISRESGGEQHLIFHWLKGESIAHIYEDSSGGLWLGSLLNGLYYLPPSRYIGYSKENGLSGSEVRDLIFSTDGELHVVYKDSRAIDMLQLDGQFQTIPMNMSDHEILGLDNFNDTIVIYRSNKLIGGSFLSPGLPSKAIKFGKHYYASIGGVSMKRRKTEMDYAIFLRNQPRQDSVPSREDGITLLPSEGMRIYSSYQDNTGKIWMATGKGLCFLKGYSITEFDSDSPLLESRLNDISGRGQLLFMASQENGLIIKDGREIWNIGEQDGLISNKLNSLHVEGNIIWCASPRGLSRIEILADNKREFKLRNFTTKDGLPSNYITKVLVRDSILYAGTSNGISLIEHHNLKPSSQPPMLYITDVLADSVSVRKFPDPSLKYGEGNITFSFMGISFESLGDVTYSYRLRGFNDQWKETKLNFMDYGRLPHGSYTFEVRAANKYGIWTEQSQSFSFTITPPIWLSWWFLSLVILASLLIVSGISYWVIYNQQKRSRIKLQIIRSEQMALQAQMNPHFMFNALNSIQSFNAENEKRKAADYLSDFSKLIRTALHNSTSSLISLEEEVQSLKLYMELENLRMDDSIDFRLHTDDRISMEEFKIPPMLIQPLLENAIWHGLSPKPVDDRILKLEFHDIDSGQGVHCIIEDNGVGIGAGPASPEKHNSVGLKNIKNRLYLLNSFYGNVFDLNIVDLNSENSSGTRIELSIRTTKKYH